MTDGYSSNINDPKVFASLLIGATVNSFFDQESSIQIIWISPFLVLGVSGEHFSMFYILHKSLCKQSVYSLVPRL